MANGIEGTNRIQAIIVDRDDVPVAQIATCLGVEYTPVLNDAGTWSARFPANDPKLVHLALKKHYLHIYVDGEIFCYGLTETWSWELANDGQRILVLGGRDSLAELDETSMATWVDEDFGGNNVPWHVIEDFNDINSIAIGSAREWSLAKQVNDDAVFPVTDMSVVGTGVGESALRILIRVSEYTGESFRLLQRGQLLLGHPIWDNPNPKRHVEWLGNQIVSSGVRAVGTIGEPRDADDNPHICFIQSLTERRDTSRMLTRIYPFGSGFGETKLDLAGISAQAIAYIGAASCAYNAAENYIWNPSAETAIEQGISKQVLFKDVRPLFNTDADMQTAKDYLAHVATAYLTRNDDINDTLEYDITVAKLPSHVKVGMTLRVVWQEDLRTIDDDFYILAIRMTVGSSGERSYQLTVATANQWRLRESNNIVAQMEEGQILGAHPQIDANSYWMAFKEEVGDNQTDHMAEMPFFLSNEVVTIRQVLFRFKLQQPLILTKTYTLAAETDLSDAVETGGSSAASTGLGGAVATGDVSTPNTGDSSISSTTGGPDSTTGVVGLPISVDVGDNDISYGGWETGTSLVTNSGDNTAAGDPHQHPIPHTHSHTHDHPAELPDHIHGTDHEHTMLHQHPMPHTHTGADHTHGMDHDHDQTPHRHALPALAMTMGLERVSVLLTYEQNDLEYAVNGGAFESMGVGNPDVLPVAGGYFEIDITSHVQNPAGLKRPYQENNLVQVRRTSAAGTGKMVQIKALLGIRTTIQSIVIYE